VRISLASCNFWNSSTARRNHQNKRFKHSVIIIAQYWALYYKLEILNKSANVNVVDKMHCK